MIRLAINGAAGRMGQRLVALGCVDPQFTIAAAMDAPQHPKQSVDAGLLAGVGEIGVPLTAGLNNEVDAIIDFSTPAGTSAAMAAAEATETPLVVATTGLEEELQQQLRQLATKIPVLWAPSMSLAVNLLMKLTSITGGALKDHPTGADVEIIERHHRFKEDSPSGTALKFGEIVAEAMGQTHHQHGREGRPGQRPHNEIGYHAVRVGDNPGEHTIIFALLGETIELAVKATSRDCYAHGALAAAKFLVNQPVGSYDMNDVLGL